MAQSQYQYPPHAFSPPQAASAPHPGAYLPPSKRQRLSPNPPSPYSSPNIPTSTLPSQVFSSPYYGIQPNGHYSAPAHDQPNPPTSTGAMGPPSRPTDKPTDMNELSDVLAGSGVDLKEEEAALYQFNNSSHAQNNVPITSTVTTAFNSTGPNGPVAGMFSALGNFNTLSQNIAGDRASFYGAGTLNQPVAPYQSIEERAEEELQRAIRRKAERRQYHLNEPFLYAATVQRSLSKHSHTLQVTIPRAGLLTSTNQSGRSIQLAVAGPDKNEVLTTLKGQDLLYQDAPLVEIITILSLAAQERVRTVVEDTATLAKGRRIGSHGVVPLEFSDLAVGNGLPESVTALPTPGTSVVSPNANPLKRSFSAANKLPTPISDGIKTPPNTIAFPNQLVQILRQSSQTERTAEEERKAKRDRRLANRIVGVDGGRSGSASLGTPAPGTLGLLGERAPDADSKKGISKKEQKRQAEAKVTEAQQHARTNDGIKMALGAIGKKLSWMQKDTPSSSNGFPVQSKTAPRSQVRISSGSGTGIGEVSGQSVQGVRRYGDFREDKETGAGIQMRDVVSVLEPEPKEKRALARAFAKLGSRG